LITSLKNYPNRPFWMAKLLFLWHGVGERWKRGGFLGSHSKTLGTQSDLLLSFPRKCKGWRRMHFYGFSTEVAVLVISSLLSAIKSRSGRKPHTLSGKKLKKRELNPAEGVLTSSEQGIIYLRRREAGLLRWSC
jgi:hypothetical protein